MTKQYKDADNSETWNEAARQVREDLSDALEILKGNRKAEMTDKEMLDWLEMQYVVVRIPLRYGSRECFQSSPVEIEADYTPEPSDLRKQIIKAQTK